jgi:putative nucleotidyltransferase with HDIG domain
MAGACHRISRQRQNHRVPSPVREYIRSLDLDAYVVGGAVRDELLGIDHADEDFLVPGVDQAGLRAALAPHGRIEDMEVHGQLVGVRFHPRDRDVGRLTRAGIEITPPRAERSTGPGHRDFEIVADPAVTVEEDMGRRDFTVNAMARRLSTGELVDPFGGLSDLARRELRTVSSGSFREDPLRLLRGLRLVSQLGFRPAGETLTAMRLEAGGLRHVSAERIGGGAKADGLGELSLLLLGRDPRRALLLARDTGVLEVVLPEFRDAIGFQLGTPRQPVPLEEHVFAVVQAAAEAGASLAVRLASLLHDLGKPEARRTGAAHAQVSAEITRQVMLRLRYPVHLRRRVVAIVAGHAYQPDRLLSPVEARRFLARHGRELAAELLDHKDADLRTKALPPGELEAHERFRALVEAELDSPTTLKELAVDGKDLIGIGYREGPELGRVLHALLADVVDDPRLNERATLLDRARAELR